MSVFYTGKGDDGTTGVLGRERVRKDDALIEAIGAVDELNSSIGVAITNITDEHVAGMLQSVQNSLFIMGAELASASEEYTAKGKITNASVAELEKAIDEINALLPKQTKFVLPGGSIGGANLHLARSICRRAERRLVACTKHGLDPELVRYLNRLSSFLFAAALKVNRKEGIEELNPSY